MEVFKVQLWVWLSGESEHNLWLTLQPLYFSSLDLSCPSDGSVSLSGSQLPHCPGLNCSTAFLSQVIGVRFSPQNLDFFSSAALRHKALKLHHKIPEFLGMERWYIPTPFHGQGQLPTSAGCSSSTFLSPKKPSGFSLAEIPRQRNVGYLQLPDCVEWGAPESFGSVLQIFSASKTGITGILWK